MLGMTAIFSPSAHGQIRRLLDLKCPTPGVKITEDSLKMVNGLFSIELQKHYTFEISKPGHRTRTLYIPPGPAGSTLQQTIDSLIPYPELETFAGDLFISTIHQDVLTRKDVCRTSKELRMQKWNFEDEVNQHL